MKKAFAYYFYLEAIIIEYAIMEDRAESILAYDGKQIIHKNAKEFISFSRKANKIMKLSEKKGSIIGRYFADDFMGQVME